MSAGEITELDGDARQLEEARQNLARWERKPLLQQVYHDLYAMLAAELARKPGGHIVELGSGIGRFREVVPDCVLTEMAPNPWIDRVENAYELSFAAGSVSDLVMMDVFHHVRYPGEVLREFRRVLQPGGRVLLLEPAIGAFGWLVYGLCHPEPIAWRAPICWEYSDAGDTPRSIYYAAQGNATRVFCGGGIDSRLADWTVLQCRRLSALSYVGAGGYSGPQLYPATWYRGMRRLDALCDHLPALFATRLFVVLEARDAGLSRCSEGGT